MKKGPSSQFFKNTIAAFIGGCSTMGLLCGYHSFKKRQITSERNAIFSKMLKENNGRSIKSKSS